MTTSIFVTSMRSPTTERREIHDQTPTPEQLVALHATSRLQTAMVGDISPVDGT